MHADRVVAGGEAVCGDAVVAEAAEHVASVERGGVLTTCTEMP